MQPTLVGKIHIEFVIVVLRARVVPRVSIVADENFRAPLLAEAPSESDECAPFDITRSVGIDLRVGCKQAGQESCAVRIMQVQLRCGLIVAPRYAAHEVIAGQRKRAAPYISRRALR